MSEERFRPEAMRDQVIEAEHHARYRFAAAVVQGRRVLDAGCGVGWGSQLLVDHGAMSVDGVDIDESAVRESRERCPRGTFVKADLTDLPFPSDFFDVVACFEAIEHVEDPLRGIAEFQRVLTPSGLALVSSPNPGVYPAGNPFHIHEFRPEDLLVAMADRFAHTRLWRQHNLIASALYEDHGSHGESTDTGLRVAVLADLSPGRDMYSLVVGSDAPLPHIPPQVTLVSSRQLDELEAAGQAILAERDAIAAERAAYAADHARIVEERTKLIAEHAAANAESVRLRGEGARLKSEAEQHATELARAQAEHAARLARAHAERDQAWLRLLQAEQDLACSLRGHGGTPASP